MTTQQIKRELQALISGKNGARYDAVIQAALRHLRGGKSASSMAPGKLEDKAKEAEDLMLFADEHDLILTDIPEERFVASGAEQRVYIVNESLVVKLNDAIYYATWRDYLHSLLLHNYFFADTAYSLRGFYVCENILYAVVEQPYIKADAIADLDEVRGFMMTNGFENTRNHDYEHKEFGVILEDLHDENVLSADGVLQFVDTVFFIRPDRFWN